MTTQYRPHRIEWTRERVGNLWGYYGTVPGQENTYFSAHSGQSILRLVRKYIHMQGQRVLDYGCGRGDMLRRLLAQGAICTGMEFSVESAAEAERWVGELGARATHFRGVVWADGPPLPVEGGSFDIVLLIEVVEHLFDNQLMPTLREAHRLLGRGGHVVVTTPHDENLAGAMMHCPECGCTFHAWQHMRSLTVGSLSKLMQEAGFQQVMCKAVFFRPAMGLLGRALLEFRRACRRFGMRSVKNPHLIYLGRKEQ